MVRSDDSFRERFWSTLPVLPGGIRLERLDSVVVPQSGPGGAAVFDVVELSYRRIRHPFLAAYRPKLLAGEALNMRRKLVRVIDELRLRNPGLATPSPMIATTSAGPRTMEVCRREGIALVDQRGTLVIERDDLFINVVGTGERPRQERATRLFRGKSSRVVRVLLATPALVRPIRALSTDARLSYAHAHAVIEQLSAAGFVERLRGHEGVRLRDPSGLLRAWIDSGEPSSVTVERFNLRATTPEVLGRGRARLDARGVRAIFTLASALREEERWVSALPHGIYCSASREVLQEEFGLRPQTPHNFLVLRPDPAVDTDAGGVYGFSRRLEHGEGVSVPQLIVDLHRVGGRGAEQGDKLFEHWLKTLPLSAENESARP